MGGKPGLNENAASSRIVENGEAKSVEIDSRVGGPIAFVADGDYVVSGDGNRIRRWRVRDGKEVGRPMDAGVRVWNIAVSRDGKWIVSGTYDVTGPRDYGMQRATQRQSSSEDTTKRWTRWTTHQAGQESRLDRGTALSVFGRSRRASNCLAPSNTTTGWLRPNFHRTGTSSPRPCQNTTMMVA